MEAFPSVKWAGSIQWNSLFSVRDFQNQPQFKLLVSSNKPGCFATIYLKVPASDTGHSYVCIVLSGIFFGTNALHNLPPPTKKKNTHYSSTIRSESSYY